MANAAGLRFITVCDVDVLTLLPPFCYFLHDRHHSFNLTYVNYFVKLIIVLYIVV